MSIPGMIRAGEIGKLVNQKSRADRFFFDRAGEIGKLGQKRVGQTVSFL